MTPVTGHPGWTWEHGLYRKGEMTVTWQNGKYRWIVSRGKHTITGFAPTLRIAIRRVEKEAAR